MTNDNTKTSSIKPFLVNVYLKTRYAIQYLYFNSLSILIARCSVIRQIHFFFFSRDFSEEMRMLAHSRHEYMHKKLTNKPNEFLLRRNIHRLEKGLLLTNRRDIFAKDYIIETVHQYLQIKSIDGDSGLLKWAFDVLSEYFSIVGSDSNIDNAKALFISHETVSDKPSEQVPQTGKALTNEFENAFTQLATERKSVRDFRHDILPDRISIDKAVTIAATAPSSCNRQPFEFRIFDNPEIAHQLASLPSGAASFAQQIPCMAIVIGKMNVSPTPADRHLMYVDGSLAAMNFMLSLQSQGIASCPINWPCDKKKDKALAKLIGLKKTERAIMFIGFGYAEKEHKVAFSARKQLNELRKYNQWQSE